MVVHLDTHVVVWLYRRLDKKISPNAWRLISRSPDIRISPVVLLELDSLIRIRRVQHTSAETIVSELDAQLSGLRVSQATLARVVEAAREIQWTGDPHDRLIVANAVVDGARLITADWRILEHFQDAVWN